VLADLTWRSRTKRRKRYGITNFSRIKQCSPSQRCRTSQPESVHRKNCSAREMVCVCGRSLSPIFVSGSFCVALMRIQPTRNLKTYEPLMYAHGVSPIASSAKHDGQEGIRPDDDIPSGRQIIPIISNIKSPEHLIRTRSAASSGRRSFLCPPNRY